MEPLVVVRQPGRPAGNMTPPEPPAEDLRSSWQRIWKSKSTATTTFYGPGKRLWLDRGEVESPLVYVHKGTLDAMPDASVIETGLPVARRRSGAVPDLPYWPSYRAATPEQRAVYWDWLLSGRNDPQIPVGYVFIYFYGLERRALVDQQDFAAIADEVLRLSKVYEQSRSFVRYANGLLWTAVWLGIHQQGVRQKTLERALRIGLWSERNWGLCLATLAKLKVNIWEKVAYRLAANDERSQRSVVTRRHAELHQQSFARKFQERFPRGLRLAVPQGDYRLEYFPASATLGRLTDAGGPLANQRVPSLAGLLGQLQPLVEIWGESVRELKAFDKAHQKVGGAEFTSSMYEALPEALWEGDHPHFDAWYNVMGRYVTPEGWTLVPVGELARLEGIAERKKLTKPQLVQLATTAGHMGLALEPDPRITGQAYAWDETVSVFPATEELGQDVASYHAAAVLLELGVAIAAADGQIDEVELRRLTNHLETQFELSTQDSARLEHLQYLLSRNPPQEFAAARTLQRTLTIEQRKVVGEFLVGIAAADSEISPPEVQALGRAYRALGLRTADLDELLHSAVTVAPPVAELSDTAGEPVVGILLDMARINAIMAETAQVSEFLREALRDDTPDDDLAFDSEAEPARPPEPKAAEAESTSIPKVEAIFDPRWEGLAPRFQGFVAVLLDRDIWPRTEVETLARTQKLMLGAALEAINEWAYDRLPDALLVEAGDEIEVQRHLLG